MDARRVQRVSEVCKEELSELIGFELDDPRLAGVTVTDVHVAPDARTATVKVWIQGDDKQGRAALAALDHAKSFLRRELAARVTIHHVPDLRFELDRHAAAPERIEVLLKRAKRTRGRDE